MTDLRQLDIVDEAGNIIGQETRTAIHQRGLLHREVHVWFYTPAGEIIFQHRAKDKDTYPDLLDATVGGHVEIGSTNEQTALQEMVEETSVVATITDLQFIQMVRGNSFDAVTQMTNNHLRAVYAYCYRGDVDQLHIEAGKALGFEAWPFERVFAATPDEQKRFIPSVFGDDQLAIFRKIQGLL